ncbi:MAG TPA: hypothetical protein EYP10_08310 [Armatimonadetes bacterium]|nr:hypothetical protein [Armatimonadota bacterium]
MPTVEADAIVHADVDMVYEFAKDAERYIEFLKDVESIRIIKQEGNERLTEWVAVIPTLQRRVRWVERDRWDDVKKMCQFEMIEGDIDSYSGTWRFEEHPDGTRMVLTVNYEYNVPLIGPLLQRVVWMAMNVNVRSILDGVKQAVEASKSLNH